MYHATADNFYLVPTAEVPVTNIYRDVILDEKDFPVKMTAYTPCFRREAGSYGKDVRGLNRLHQFDKVEIVQLSLPEKSYEALDGMVAHVESIVKALELPYRILRLCGGDMSFTSALTYDFEVYSEAQKRWLEVSSVSNFESFQANRLKLRYKDADKKTRLAHTPNGSSLALPRIVLAAALLPGLDARACRRVGWRDRHAHESPNSAWSEAAFAGALGLRLGGPAWYGPLYRDHPWLGDGTPLATARHIRQAVRLMWGSLLVFATLASLLPAAVACI